MKTGLHDITDAEYFAADGLSNSYLWRLINQTPAHAQVPFPRTDEMTIGSATHLAVLQPELAAKTLKQGPATRRGKAWAEAKEAAEAEGLLLLTENDFAQVEAMRDAVWRTPEAASLLTGANAKYEQAAFWNFDGEKCKCKVDMVNPDTNTIVDLKTSVDASPRGFANSVAKYGYHQQAASYKFGYGEASDKAIHHFIFLVVEKSPPFCLAIYELDAPSTSEGWSSYLAAIEMHKKCRANQHFHGYAQEKVLLQLPAWAFRNTNPREINLGGS